MWYTMPMSAEKKKRSHRHIRGIRILYEDADSFLVELDKSSTKNLWPEDEIILTTDEIFEGKVMIK